MRETYEVRHWHIGDTHETVLHTGTQKSCLQYIKDYLPTAYGTFTKDKNIINRWNSGYQSLYVVKESATRM